MTLEEAWYIIYSSRAPELPEAKRREMAASQAARGEVPPPLRYDPPTASLREIVVESVGYVGAAEAWDLRRRLEKGGLTKILDFFPGYKEQGLNVLGMLGGIGIMATTVKAFLDSDPNTNGSLELFGAGYAAFHYSAQQFSKRLADERIAREVKAVTIATAAASAPDEAQSVVNAGAAVLTEKKPPKEEQRV